MMTKDEIITVLNGLLSSAAWAGALSFEEEMEWKDVMKEYEKIKEEE